MLFNHDVRVDLLRQKIWHQHQCGLQRKTSKSSQKIRNTVKLC